MKHPFPKLKKPLITTMLSVLSGLILLQAVEAQRQPPEEHQGVSVVSLGVLPESSLEAQLGLKGYKMQMREITLEPGGQIARHDHYQRPGLVWTLSGSWVEGRPSGEEAYPDTRKEAIVEDESTDHWFWNDGDEAARVVVCDLVPAA